MENLVPNASINPPYSSSRQAEIQQLDAEQSNKLAEVNAIRYRKLAIVLRNVEDQRRRPRADLRKQTAVIATMPNAPSYGSSRPKPAYDKLHLAA